MKSEWNLLFYIGGKMKLRVLFVFAAVCVVLMAAESFATVTCYSAPDTCEVCRDQTGTITVLDLHACDTVRIGCPVCVNGLVPGDSFAIPIYLYNDAKLSSLSLPFRHYGTHLRFGFGGDGGVDPTGSFLTTTQQAGLSLTLDEGDPPDEDTVSCLVGWIDLSGTKPLAINTTGAAKLLGYLYWVQTPGITSEVVRFDTAFYPPAGEWIANNQVSVLSGVAEHPKFVICKSFTPPCDIALPTEEVTTGSLPQKFELGQNTPNPFNPNTTIVFAVPRPAQVRVEVFNVLGQKVKTLANEFSKAGYKRVEWDGTDESGSVVASGIYLYRLTSGDFSETKKMLLLK
jgi:hypothetical protein